MSFNDNTMAIANPGAIKLRKNFAISLRKWTESFACFAFSSVVSRNYIT